MLMEWLRVIKTRVDTDGSLSHDTTALAMLAMGSPVALDHSPSSICSVIIPKPSWISVLVEEVSPVT
jgi:hypothetical protein